MSKIAIINRTTNDRLWVSNWKPKSNEDVKNAYKQEPNKTLYALAEITKDNILKIIW